jgi:hypothetical protein
MTRKTFLQAILLAPLAATFRLRAAAPHMEVLKTPTCGCCGKWVEHMRANGFDLKVQEVESTAEARRKHGVPDSLMSCHTGVVEGYSIEGHVPASDVLRLLKEKPKAKGLALPGMPSGSPGMEGMGGQEFAVMIFDEKGNSSIYKKHQPA